MAHGKCTAPREKLNCWGSASLRSVRRADACTRLLQKGERITSNLKKWAFSFKQISLTSAFWRFTRPFKGSLAKQAHALLYTGLRHVSKTILAWLLPEASVQLSVIPSSFTCIFVGHANVCIDGRAPTFQPFDQLSYWDKINRSGKPASFVVVLRSALVPLRLNLHLVRNRATPARFNRTVQLVLQLNLRPATGPNVNLQEFPWWGNKKIIY